MQWAIRSRLIWAVVAVAIIGIAVYGYRAFSAPPELPALKVTERPIERILAAVGRVRAQETVSVFSRVPGQVLSLTKREGDTVQEGDVLGQLDDRQARAALAQATASTESQHRRWTQLRRDLARTQALLKKGYATRASAEKDQSAADAAANDLQRLESAAAEARLRLADYEIRAPMAGRILTRPVDTGQVVDVRTEIYQLGSGLID
jgi:RND family efflux transporter MFP subunit